jgi:hypothetical protein
MSIFSLGVILLQRLDVFGIILILIYFLYQKKENSFLKGLIQVKEIILFICFRVVIFETIHV